MTFYQSRPVTIEAYRFDGSGANAQHLIEWFVRYVPDGKPIFHPSAEAWESEDGQQGHSGWPAQFDLGIYKTKVASVGDYIVRFIGLSVDGVSRSDIFKVLTEEDFKATYDHSCPTCSGRVRQTTNLVCTTCGHDYAKGR